MPARLRDYIVECAQEIPNAFRRGVVAVTLLTNAALAVALYAGWHMNAFTTLQLWTAAVAMAALEIVLIAPYRLWKSNKAAIEEGKDKLKAMSQDRPLHYDHADFNHAVNKKAGTCNFSATIYFAHSGDQMMKWRLRSWSIEANGKKLSSPAATTDYFVHKGQQAWYHIPSLQDVPVKNWPVSIDIAFDLEYDNVPPLSVRGSKRLIRYVVPAGKSKNVPASDLLSEER